MKQPPKLTLVSNLVEQTKGSVYTLVAVESLEDSIKDNLIEISTEVFPSSILIASLRSTQANVFHPVILLEDNKTPMILKIMENNLGEELISSLAENFSRYQVLSSSMKSSFSWGILNKKIWYCRKLVDKTLEQYLEQKKLRPADAVRIALDLLEKIEKLHQSNLVHGHICLSNIYLSSDSNLELFDPFIAINLLKKPEYYFRYELGTFAPEYLTDRKISYHLDLYGFGLALKGLYQNLEKSKEKYSDLELAELKTIKSLFELLLDKNVEKRLSLELIRSCLTNSSNLLSSETKLSSSKSKLPVYTGEELSPPLPEAPPLPSFVENPLKSNNNLFYLLCFVSVLFALFIVKNIVVDYFFNREDPEPISTVNVQSLKEEWNSKIPSRMQQVALDAISEGEGYREAEAVIIASAKKNEDNGIAVNNQLIKVAFTDLWEMELNPGDRRAALVMGLAGLLKNQTIPPIPNSADLHPGVVLAMLSTLDANNEAVKSLLSNVPIENLLKLPAPFFGGFKVLYDANPKANCSEPAVVMLSALGTKAIALEKLYDFIKINPILHIKALTKILSKNEDNVKIVFELLTTNQLFQGIGLESLSWAKAFSLVNWKDLTLSQKLSLLAGDVEFDNLMPENILKLMAHPIKEVRAKALGLALISIKFDHPASMEVIKRLQEKPDMLNIEQTVEMVKLLVNPYNLDLETVNKWLEKKPDIEILKILLLSSVGTEKGSIIDTAIAAELKKDNWKPGIDILRKLCSHPDKFTRLFAYNEIFSLEDKESAKELLTLASSSEKDEASIEQLKQMISTFVVNQ